MLHNPKFRFTRSSDQKLVRLYPGEEPKNGEPVELRSCPYVVCEGDQDKTAPCGLCAQL